MYILNLLCSQEEASDFLIDSCPFHNYEITNACNSLFTAVASDFLIDFCPFHNYEITNACNC